MNKLLTLLSLTIEILSTVGCRTVSRSSQSTDSLTMTVSTSGTTRTESVSVISSLTALSDSFRLTIDSIELTVRADSGLPFNYVKLKGLTLARRSTVDATTNAVVVATDTSAISRSDSLGRTSRCEQQSVNAPSSPDPFHLNWWVIALIVVVCCLIVVYVLEADIRKNKN